MKLDVSSPSPPKSFVTPLSTFVQRRFDEKYRPSAVWQTSLLIYAGRRFLPDIYFFCDRYRRISLPWHSNLAPVKTSINQIRCWGYDILFFQTLQVLSYFKQILIDFWPKDINNLPVMGSDFLWVFATAITFVFKSANFYKGFQFQVEWRITEWPGLETSKFCSDVRHRRPGQVPKSAFW